MYINYCNFPFPKYNIDEQINPLFMPLKNKKNNSNTVAHQVEAMFIQILLKSMRKTLPKKGLLNNFQTNVYTEFYDLTISQTVSKKSIGLAQIIQKQIETQKTNEIINLN